MKSASESICFQEIPDEISLSFSISNCPNRCEGCHSPHLREDCGEDVFWKLPPMLRKYKDIISCVLFFGGDDKKQKTDLKVALYYCKLKGFKTALYSGFDTWPANDILEQLDYVKIGSYKKDLGGLKSSSTNQRLYKKENGKWEDITHMFWSSPIEK